MTFDDVLWAKQKRSQHPRWFLPRADSGCDRSMEWIYPAEKVTKALGRRPNHSGRAVGVARRPRN